ncbi:MAG: hypothetical protein M1814_003046 [Vezdaea aestivalis]|nr:MAG: hypothetical protein M1814_003046 [Vezdaea aestivalis]
MPAEYSYHPDHHSKLQEWLKSAGPTLGPPITLTNNIDETLPPSDFGFISTYMLSDDTVELPGPEFQSGCDCKPNMGHFVGCEYLELCSCLADATRSRKTNKLFWPYNYKGILKDEILESRDVVYECNPLYPFPSAPTPSIRLTFLSPKGLRTREPLQKGQLIEVYHGELVSEPEAQRRENLRNQASSQHPPSTSTTSTPSRPIPSNTQPSSSTTTTTRRKNFLFSLDKFQTHPHFHTPSMLVVDGEKFGSPARFANHSCEPNARQVVVVNQMGNMYVYKIALFARREIGAWEEVTFDYLDGEVGGEGGDEEAMREGRERCLCAERGCRGWLWE